MPTQDSEGKTPSERYLHYLCRSSFLTPWSFSNLYTDEGRKQNKGTGNELCDLLAVFGNDVIIFSVKHVDFTDHADLDVNWKRWFKKAIEKSSGQIFGAQQWIRSHPNRIFRDPKCEYKLEISLPDLSNMRIHRVAIALGAHDACVAHFGQKSLGSLIVNSRVLDDQHYQMPFTIGRINSAEDFVHVFDDLTMDIVIRELDTLPDFILYLSKKEKLILNEKPGVLATGEEQLLAYYLTHVNSNGEHDFTFPDSAVDGFFLDEGFWESLKSSDGYRAKKSADEVSYAWDRLIEHLHKCVIRVGKLEDPENCATNFEPALRLMAAEPRLRRRELASALIELMNSAPATSMSVRLVISKEYTEKLYVFLVYPNLGSEPYEDYLASRREWLIAYCKVAKLDYLKADYVIGIATEPMESTGRTESVVMLDVRNWTNEMQEEAEWLRTEHSLLVKTTREPRNTREYPIS